MGRLFDDVIKGAGPHRLDGSFQLAYRRHENDRRIRRNTAGMLHYVDSIGGGDLDVGDPNIVERAVEFLASGLAGSRHVDLVAIFAQHQIEQLADGAIVIADEQITHVPLRLATRTIPDAARRLPTRAAIPR